MADARVGVIMGSKSDWDVVKHACTTLEDLGIPFEAKVLSAHRTPEETADWARSASDRGIQVVIAAAGGAAALPGVIAASTHLPVLGVPMESQALKGMDSLLSMVQMPAGVPVGTLAIGKAGAVNAALLSAAIIALGDEDVRERLVHFRAAQAATVLAVGDPSLV